DLAGMDLLEQLLGVFPDPLGLVDVRASDVSSLRGVVPGVTRLITPARSGGSARSSRRRPPVQALAFLRGLRELIQEHGADRGTLTGCLVPALLVHRDDKAQRVVALVLDKRRRLPRTLSGLVAVHA